MDPLGHSAFQKRNHRIDGLRHLAAVGVIFTHSYKLSIDGGNDPLHDLFGLNASYLSLGLFFSISGFLVTGSLLRNNNIKSFTLSRIFRIFPAIIVANILTIVVLSIFSTYGFGEYFLSTQTLHYIVLNSTLITSGDGLPGVFTNNSFPNAVNGSLWTLPVEVKMYLLLALLGFLATLMYSDEEGAHALTKLVMISGIIGYSSVVVWEALELPTHPRWASKGAIDLAGFFFVGMLLSKIKIISFFRYENSLILILFYLVETYYFNRAPGDSIVFPILMCQTMITFGINCKDSNSIFSKNVDLSYGIYIYAFPIQQLIYSHYDNLSPIMNFFYSAILSSIMAYLSWNIVEKPSLNFRKKIGNAKKIDTE